jgi:hypothetical protein
MSSRRHGLWLCDSEGPDISQGLAAGPPDGQTGRILLLFPQGTTVRSCAEMRCREPRFREGDAVGLCEWLRPPQLGGSGTREPFAALNDCVICACFSCICPLPLAASELSEASARSRPGQSRQKG